MTESEALAALVKAAHTFRDAADDELAKHDVVCSSDPCDYCTAAEQLTILLEDITADSTYCDVIGCSSLATGWGDPEGRFLGCDAHGGSDPENLAAAKAAAARQHRLDLMEARYG